MVNIKLFPFQEDISLKLVELTNDINSKQTIQVKAPTGAGKTIILIDYIDKFLKVNSNTAFIWLCPGKGELEEQSKSKMKKISPDKNVKGLSDSLLSGFEENSITFINWELLTKKGNLALRDGEKKNLQDRIKEANNRGIEFIIIVDEEHANKTNKANDIINRFSPKNIIRVSATIKEETKLVTETIEVPEIEVISEGLLTKAIYINEGIEDGYNIDEDYITLLEIADNKRKLIANKYSELSKKVRPLVLIQFPNGQDETIENVEKKLESMGYTYENGMVAIWMDKKKENLEGIEENDGTPVFLLMKQAIATGWDCPRAKILVKLRENMSDTFEIQTIGRIRRMPEATHYDEELLDLCYIYTFDEKYKSEILSSVTQAYETRRLFLKEKVKYFTIEKQTRNLEYAGLGQREILEKLREHYISKYNLGKDIKDNELRLEANGYNFIKEIQKFVVSTKQTTLAQIQDNVEEYNRVQINKQVDTKLHGFEMLSAIDGIKKIVSMENNVIKSILDRLFRDVFGQRNKLLKLNNKELYAFIINNKEKLKEEFREITQDVSIQNSLVLEPKISMFKIPEQDFFRYDINNKNEVEFKSNAYEKYTSGNVTSLVKSMSELLFEKYCENSENVDWVYKNGDSGQQYFSIVYIDGIGKQWLFYPDYIVKMKNNDIWIIETKGGEARGVSKNIDKQVENKFNAFKDYANRKNNLNIKWGFVRDKDSELYLNNTNYTEDMSNDEWKPISEIF